MIKIVNLIFQLIFGILHFFGNSKSDLRGTIFNLGKEILKDIDFKEILLVGISIWSLSQFFTEKQTVLLFGVFYATFSYIKYLHKTKITKDEIEELIDRKVRKS